MNCVVFTGGGTGGHIFPGLAVAEIFSSKTNYRIYWIGSNGGADKNIVESEEKISNLKFISIPAGKLRRYFSLKNFIDIFKTAAGFIKSFFILLKLKPAFVFSKGGFVSVPPCAAAKLLKIPVITHECDFSPGLATKLNSKFASHILTSYNETINQLSKAVRGKAVCTGNPVRLSFYSADEKKGRDFIKTDSDKPILLVLGGSLGARQINDLIFDSIEFLAEHFTVVHQTGEKNIEQGKEISEKLKKSQAAELNPSICKNYKPYAFIKNEMPDILKAASIIVSRAGANTVWESAAAGKPMILIPLEKGSSRGDQIENAEFFKLNGAAAVLKGDEVSSDNFTKIVKEFLDNPEKLKKTAEASGALAKEKPACIIADFLMKFLDE
ncbi:undecaprenyldiphospho-muramoylpentapeptide beta-N-acetylglucosaminyltransferase [Treponema pedis]|uniref:undecaprenyldiphospho-muramoylpentapeptide beta-N-acetylglucosaminyltransferase n=1 Tax=Treponema pedis TaxID=409322 RepID=UPI0003FDA1AD|nr:undecaprenyldiphospho-muramoylpentapeptide beta-N-acetylglucosaminyltransferase [Treponema pedis]